MQNQAFGGVEKIRWYSFKKLRFSNVIKVLKIMLKRLNKSCQAFLVAHQT